MQPSLIHDILSEDQVLYSSFGIDAERVIESQSVDERPFDYGYFITISLEETNLERSIYRGPRTVTIAIHRSWNEDRDYAPINSMLNRIQRLFVTVDCEVGTDDIMVSQFIPQGRSGNQQDEGWETITRSATYGVLYDETQV